MVDFKIISYACTHFYIFSICHTIYIYTFLYVVKFIQLIVTIEEKNIHHICHHTVLEIVDLLQCLHGYKMGVKYHTSG